MRQRRDRQHRARDRQRQTPAHVKSRADNQRRQQHRRHRADIPAQFRIISKVQRVRRALCRVVNGGHQSRHGKAIRNRGEKVARNHRGDGISEKSAHRQNDDMHAVADIADLPAFAFINQSAERH